MEKIMNRFLLVILGVILTSVSAFAIILNSSPYYDCPSMEKFSPLVFSSTYCRTEKNLKPSEYSACLREYKEKYTSPRKEYRLGKCEPSEVRYAQLGFGTSTCKIDFVTGDKPRIVKVESYSFSRNSVEKAKCVERLKANLKKAYPKIEE